MRKKDTLLQFYEKEIERLQRENEKLKSMTWYYEEYHRLINQVNDTKKRYEDQLAVLDKLIPEYKKELNSLKKTATKRK